MKNFCLYFQSYFAITYLIKTVQNVLFNSETKEKVIYQCDQDVGIFNSK